MEIKDLFSHKIHSSTESWENKLIDIASIFNRFDGKPYDREAIEYEFSKISPRASKLSFNYNIRDLSKFRDEISAYFSYLGLYKIKFLNNRWYLFLSQTAKQFLTNEEPDVSSFMLLQLILFQYPNGMGFAYSSNNTSFRIQSNTRDRTLSFIKNNIRFSPIRLICKALLADADIRGVKPSKASISYDEVFALVNSNLTNSNINPNLENVIGVLHNFRSGKLKIPKKYESRFHILNHTNFLEASNSTISIRKPISLLDEKHLEEKLFTLNNIDKYFNKFDMVENVDDIEKIIISGEWSDYFDGIKTLDHETISKLTNLNQDILGANDTILDSTKSKYTIIKSDVLYDFKDICFSNTNPNYDRKSISIDPEVTRIKRQRANLEHKIILERIYSYLNDLNAKLKENEHIDLFAELPTGTKYIFEVKSTNTENLLSQARKGLSQLYEYRYRYKNIIGYDVKLCLVFNEEPQSINWLQEYLASDRDVGIIWFDKSNNIKYSKFSKNIVLPILQNAI